MNDDRRKRLTEFLGEKWEPFEVKEWPHYSEEYGLEWSAFPVEGVEPSIRHVQQKHRDFTTAQDMVDLAKRLVETGKVHDFQIWLWYSERVDDLKQWEVAFWLLTDPARFNDLVGEFLEGEDA